MRADDDNAAVICLANDHLLSGKKRLVCHATHNLNDSRGRAEHKYFPLGHRAEQCNAEYFQIRIVYRIHNDLVEISDRQKLLLDLVVRHIMDIFEGNAGDVFRFICAAGLFFHIGGHGSCFVAECLVFCKFRLAGIDKLITVFDIVNIVDGVPSALLEERA